MREIEGGTAPAQMPVRYVIEMFMDRIAASKVYNKDKYTDASPLEYYKQGKNRNLIHPKTAKQLEILLRMLASEGEEKTFTYIRTVILKHKM